MRLFFLISLIIAAWNPLALASNQADNRPVLVFGDSLSAAYGLREEQGWAYLLKDYLLRDGVERDVINLSVSGETSGGGLARLPSAIERHNPGILVLELGANDGLRGLSPKRMQRNLTKMIEAAQANEMDVLLLGMRLPPSYGARYVSAFEAVYPAVAESTGIALMPFMLEVLGVDETLYQADRLHPTAEAQPMLLDAIYPFLKPLL